MALIKKIDKNVPKASKGEILSSEELLYLRQVRHELHRMNQLSENTVFQKTLDFFTEEDLGNYIRDMNDSYNMGVKGSIIIASDAKHLNTTRKIFDGQGMDYGGPFSPYNPNASYYQIRYTTADYSKAKLPVSGELDEFIKSHGADKVYISRDIAKPYTGTSFTPDAPELLSDGYQRASEALIVKISPDGTEVPVAVTVVDKDTKKLRFEVL